MESVIVTGATSFIGVHLIKELLPKNIMVYAIVRPNSNNLYRLSEIEKSSNLKIISLDMHNILDLYAYIKESVSCFYHFAWEGARTPNRDNSRLQEDNYFQTLKAFHIAKLLEVKKFIVSGSQAEYGIVNGRIDENHRCQPVTEYGKYKLNAYEKLCKLADESKICLIWARIFSVYGRYDYPDTLVMSCIRKMKNDEPVNLTKCIQKWDYVYVEDIAKAFVKFGEIDCESGVYNLASGIARPLYEYVDIIKKVLGSKSQLNFGAIPYSSSGPVSLEPVVAKVENALEWKAEKTFEEGIRDIIKSDY